MKYWIYENLLLFHEFLLFKVDICRSIIVQKIIEVTYFGETNLGPCIKLILTALFWESTQNKKKENVFFFFKELDVSRPWMAQSSLPRWRHWTLSDYLTPLSLYGYRVVIGSFWGGVIDGGGGFQVFLVSHELEFCVLCIVQPLGEHVWKMAAQPGKERDAGAILRGDGADAPGNPDFGFERHMPGRRRLPSESIMHRGLMRGLSTKGRRSSFCM
jgi:hypothetical protein